MLKRASLAMALALAAMALVASSAAAEIKWSHSTAGWSGSLTFKRNGGNAKTCTFVPTSHAMNTPSSPAWFQAVPLTGWKVSCGTPFHYMEWAPEGYPEGNPKKGYVLEFWDWLSESGEWRASAWSDRKWMGDAAWPFAVIPFTNAAGGNPSKVTFSNTYVGETNFGEAVTATGSLSVLNGKNSVTLSGE